MRPALAELTHRSSTCSQPSFPPAKPHKWPAASNVLKPTVLATPYTSSSSATTPDGVSQQLPPLSHELPLSPTSHSIVPHCPANFSPAGPGKLPSSGKAPSSTVFTVCISGLHPPTAWILGQDQVKVNWRQQ